MSEYAEYQPQINQKFLCITDHGVMGAIPQQIAESEKHNLFPLFGCLLKGSPIFTYDGVKNIEDVIAGEYVLTHKGRYRRVLRTMTRLHKGEMCHVYLSDSKNISKFSLTSEHPILIRNEFKELSFIEAGLIKVGRRTTKKGINSWNSYVCFPRKDEFKDVKLCLNDYMPNHIGSKKGYIAKLYARNKYESLIDWKNIPEFINLDVNLAKLLGLYVSEGSVRIKNGEPTGTFTFSFNSKTEQLLANEVVDLLRCLFGIESTVFLREDKSLVEVIGSCLPLSYFFMNACGKDSKNKKIPSFIFRSNSIIRLVFLSSLLDGDGKNPNTDINKSRTLKVASKQLAYGFKRCLAIDGEWANVLNVQENKNDKLCTYWQVSYYPSRTFSRFIFDENYVYKPIQKISKEIGEWQVYNIEVEEDNSYVSDFSLHNCELYINAMQPKVKNRTESAEYRKTLGDGSTPERTYVEKLKASPLQKKFDKSRHLLAIAYNDIGYSNLVRLSSWAWIHGYYRKPRVNHEVLEQYKEGIIFTSTCANSEIAGAFFDGGDDAGFAMIEKYMAMFGSNFYLELMMLDFKDQKPYDAFLIRAHDKYHIPMILTQDCHYCKKEHSHNQRLMLMQQNKKTLADFQGMIDSGDTEDAFELQDSNLWLKSEDELNEMWEAKFQDTIDYDIYKQAKANTVLVAEFCKGVKIDREIKLPKMPDADAVLWDEIKKGFVKRGCPKTSVYIKRIKEEYDLITEKGFASYFLIQKLMVDEARRKGPELLGFGDGSESVGPGRGSVCGSLVAYCLRLHDVEPIIHDLRFSRFLSPARGGKQMRIRHTIQPLSHEEIKV